MKRLQLLFNPKSLLSRLALILLVGLLMHSVMEHLEYSSGTRSLKESSKYEEIKTRESLKDNEFVSIDSDYVVDVINSSIEASAQTCRFHSRLSLPALTSLVRVRLEPERAPPIS